MRKPLLSLLAVALVAVGCSSLPPRTRQAARSRRIRSTTGRPPHRSLRRPRPTAGSPSRTRASTRMSIPMRTRSRRSRSTSTPPRTRSRSASSPTAIGRIPRACGSKSGSMPSTRAIAAPADEAFAVLVDGGPTPFIEGDEVLVRIGLQARAVREPSPRGRLADLRPRHLGLDGARGPSRAGQGRARGSSWTSSVRTTASRSSSSATGRRTRPRPSTSASRPRRDPRRDRLAPARRLHEPRRRPPSRLRAGARVLTENGIDRVVLALDGVANVGLTDAD